MAVRALLWLTFAAVLVVSCQGFFGNRLLAQGIWEPAGVSRLAWYSLAFFLWWLVMGLWNPKRFLYLTCGLAAAYATASSGLGAVCAAALFLAASSAAGDLAMGRGAADEDGLEDAMLRLLCGVSFYIFILSLIVRVRVNYPATYLALLALPLLANPRALPALVARVSASLKRDTPLSGRDIPSLGALLFVLIAHLLVVLKPETSADGLAMHLTVPAYVEYFHYWPFDVSRFTWAVMPMGADWCFTIAYLLGGEQAARLFNYSMALATAALLYAMCRRYVSRPLALLLAALWASSPITQLVTGSLLVENVWAAVALGAVAAVLRYRDTGEVRFARLAAFLCGTGLAVKLGGLAFAVPVAIVAGVRIRQARLAAFGAAALALIAAAPPYLTSFLKTGNPIFPFANHIFKSPYFDSSAAFIDPRFMLPLTPKILYDLTFRTHQYFEGQNGSLGFHYLVLLPFAAAVFLVDRQSLRQAGAVAFVLTASFVLTFRAQSNLRYVYPTLPLCMVVGAVALAWLREADGRLFRLLCASLSCIWILNMWFLPSASWYHKEFFLNTLFDRREVESYLDAGAPGRRLTAYLNLKRPQGAVAFLEMDEVAGYHGTALSNGWHHERFARRLDEASSAEDCRKVAQEFNVEYFVAPMPESGIAIRQPSLTPFLSRFTVREFRVGSFYVARVKTGAELEAESARVVAQDDTSSAIRYSGEWTHATFPMAAGSTVSYSNTPGAGFQVEFDGPEIVYGYTKAFNRGKARIRIDGTDKGTLDQYSPSVQWRTPLVLGGLAPGKHRLEVQVLPERNPRSSDGYVDLDYIELR